MYYLVSYRARRHVWIAGVYERFRNTEDYIEVIKGDILAWVLSRKKLVYDVKHGLFEGEVMEVEIIYSAVTCVPTLEELQRWDEML